MPRFCSTCGRSIDEHQVEEVVTPEGRRNMRVCPIERRPGPRLVGKPDRYRYDERQAAEA